jgi:orotidine-5'-phosphate decarboxylase
MEPIDRLICALDVVDRPALDATTGRLEGVVRWIKVGSMLFNALGPDVVRDLVGRGWRVFVDLKLHDIPHQVAGSIAVLGDLGASLVTVHTGGGPEMLEAAAKAAEPYDMTVLGVTVLTSMDAGSLGAVGVVESPAEAVLRRAQLAWQSGVKGVVSSPLEAAMIRRALSEIELVTPGIRPAGSDVGDQKRIATPQSAIASGATRLVVGRPILTADDPVLAARQILAAIGDALGQS